MYLVQVEKGPPPGGSWVVVNYIIVAVLREWLDWELVWLLTQSMCPTVANHRRHPYPAGDSREPDPVPFSFNSS